MPLLKHACAHVSAPSSSSMSYCGISFYSYISPLRKAHFTRPRLAWSEISRVGSVASSGTVGPGCEALTQFRAIVRAGRL